MSRKKAMGISNNEIKTIRSLGIKKFRDSMGLFIVEGEKMVAEAIDSGFIIDKIYRRDDIGAETMAKISQLSTPSPVLAVIRQPEIPGIKEISEIVKNNGLYLALDSIRDPGNFGTILRIADWFGIDAVFASSDTVDIYNPKTVQSTMGAIFRVKLYYFDIETLADNIINAKGQVYGTFLDGNNIYTEEIATGKNTPVLIVIGNEAKGISASIAKKVTGKLFIPSYAKGNAGSESLNAAIATAVTIAEFRRRF